MNPRGKDTQLVKMSLRRIQQNMEDASKLEVPLNLLVNLVKTSRTAADNIREEKGLIKLVKLIKHHKDKPQIVEKVSVILSYTISHAGTDEMCVQSATDVFYADIINDVVTIMMVHMRQESGLTHSVVNLLASLTFNFGRTESSRETIKKEFVKANVLNAVSMVMTHYLDKVEICTSCVMIVFLFEYDDNLEVQRLLCGKKLNIAIEAAVRDFRDNNGRKLDRDNNDELVELLAIPALVSAIYDDPVLGPLRRAYDRHTPNCSTYDQHKDFIDKIQDLGLKVQLAAIRLQKGEAKLFQCMNCNKKLSKKTRCICSKCRGVIYCSRECQTTHWNASHKKKCRDVLLQVKSSETK